MPPSFTRGGVDFIFHPHLFETVIPRIQKFYEMLIIMRGIPSIAHRSKSPERIFTDLLSERDFIQRTSLTMPFLPF
jgi:hypothetical protein